LLQHWLPSGFLVFEKLILIAPSPPTPEPMDEYMKKQLLTAYNKPGKLRKIINKITLGG
jgi:hypothetical protein